MADFETGKQPCARYTPYQVAYGPNVHECFCGYPNDTCSMLVSFCENCNRDHHQDGYENCKCGRKP